jgi:hypothetical protein
MQGDNHMDLTQERATERIERETSALDLERHGEAMLTVAKALLGVDLILVSFVDISVRTGSRLFVWWVIAEGLLGLLLVIIGLYQESEAHKELSALEPKNAEH